MIKLFQEGNQEVGGGGRSYYRSPEITWPVLSTSSSTLVYVNHNLNTRCVRMSMLATINGTGSYNYPYGWFRDDHSGVQYFGWWYYTLFDLNTATIQLRRWQASTVTFIVDVWGEEDHPEL